MFNKKLKIVLLLLVFILSISAVSAADNNGTDDVIASDLDDEPPSMVPQDSSTNEQVSSEESSYSMQANNVTMYYKGTNKYSGVLTKNGNPLVGAPVNFWVNGTTYTKNTDSNGKVTFALYNLKPGTYMVSMAYGHSATSKNTITVKHVVSASNVVAYYKAGSTFTAKFLDSTGKALANTDITFKFVGSNSYTRKTNSNGVASIALNMLVGTYTINSIHPNGDMVTNTINVKHAVTAKDMTVCKGAEFTAKFLDGTGKALANKDITFKFVGSNSYTKTTDSNGVASITLNMAPGTYTIKSIHPGGDTISNKITVKDSIVSSDFEKHYLSAKVFTARFYGTDAKPLANSNVRYYTNQDYTIKTDANGYAKISVNSFPGTYSIQLINPVTGEKKTNKIKVLSPIDAPATITTFAGTNTKYKLTLYVSESLAKNKKMNIYVDGVKKTVTTDDNGVATLTFKFDKKGTYYIKPVDPRTGYQFSTKVTVNRATIVASDVVAIEGITTKFTATLLNLDGSVAKNTKMKITINNVAKTLTTNTDGVATYSFKLNEGTYNAVCEDLKTGYKLTKKVYVLGKGTNVYDENGVSLDGKTILAIGRPSTASEESKYGYTFYKVQLTRTCSYCGSHNLYWSIFFAGNEYDNWGRFPATGNMEGGSAEGIIICADCDSDWSIYGHNHGGGGGDLTALTTPVKTTKQDAYDLLAGDYVYIKD
ncbi:hypothetical protein TL18_06790 [Methanobrevibacter sp. YE315]|uniref:Ig-like domain-containing protein n=1 Tax=Methanobrevibacter sp. YE315 TaxID=1609968 RepID=UPI000764D38A|nr:Ig-like domain-containing protein [Methanobrevibacter sp. YE315]AMD17747.1 hypothetical protein TL18_06790 [Methanobrevibacter sp. YE315]